MDRRRGAGKQKRPSPDSAVGRLLAELMSGEWVSAQRRVGAGGYPVEYLRSCYDMEIESKLGPGGGVRLLGEWDGPYFVPVERMRPYPDPEDYH